MRVSTRGSCTELVFRASPDRREASLLPSPSKARRGVKNGSAEIEAEVPAGAVVAVAGRAAVKPIGVARAVAIVGALSPLGWAGWLAATGGLGANPIEKLTHLSGDSALILLCASLAVTPLRRVSGLGWLAPLRRTLGLSAFFWGLGHFVIYAVFDQGLAIDDVIADVAKRPYVTVGFAAFLMLLSLAITSTRGWQKRLGKRWRSLHRLAYVSVVLGVVHYWWLVKADITWPLAYAIAAGIVLCARGVPALAGRLRASSPQ